MTSRVGAAVYRFILHLYPRTVRIAFARGMMDTYQERVAAARSAGGLRLALWVMLRETAGAAWSAPSAWRPRRGGHRSGAPTPRQWGRHVARDTQHAARRLRRTPGFTIAAVLTLALGIGANTAIFSVVYGVVIRPLPYAAPDRVVSVDSRAPGIGVERGLGLTRGLYWHYRTRSRTLEEVAIYSSSFTSLTGDGNAERVSATRTTHTLAAVLGVPPVVGRWFREDDAPSTTGAVVVVGYDLWERRYDRDPHIVGRTIRIDGNPVEVIGVMPRRFRFPTPETALWLPVVVDETTPFGGFNFLGVGRLRADVGAGDAERDLNGLVPLLPDAFGARFAQSVVDDAKLAARVVPLADDIVGDVRTTLWILLGTVGFVLLIACANVANLFLVRAEARQREVALRTALGASRGVLVRHFLAESTLLSAAGGLLGLALAAAGVRALVRIAPPGVPRLHEVAVDLPVLAFTAAIALAASALFGLVPAVRRGPSLAVSLRDGGHQSSDARGGLRTRRALLVVQVGLAMTLLIGAGLLVRSFWSMRSIDPGFRADDAATFYLGLPVSDYPDRARATAFVDEVLPALEALPGVTSAAMVSCLPLDGWCGGDPLSVEGRPPEPGVIPPIVALRTASAGYFESMGIPVRAGRTLRPDDHVLQTDVVVISEELARQYFPGEDPIGKRIYHGADPNQQDISWYTIVGVVADVPARTLTDVADPLIYFPLRSHDDRGPSPHGAAFVLRTAVPPLEVIPMARRAVAAIDPDLPIARVRTLDRILADGRAEVSFAMVLLGIASLLALVLGGIGVYGVFSYVVSRRRAEIGVRIALGANAADVRSMVVRQGMAVAGVGVLVGLLGGVASTRLLDALLYGVAPTDLPTFLGVATVLLAVAFIATYLPARRAAQVSPVEAIRE